MHQIVMVGGGAGGLEFATKLGDHLGRNSRKPKADIHLVDINPTHLWKPLLHEVAVGSIDLPIHQVEYAAQARHHGFSFHQGALVSLNRQTHAITIASVSDETGEEIFPTRTLLYDTLILGIGSVSHFFNIPGAEKYSFSLDNATQAEHFRRRFITACHQVQQEKDKKPLSIAIIGAGATGVELAAELRNAAQVLSGYGFQSVNSVEKMHIHLIEAAPRILSALSEQTSNTTESLLKKLSIEVKTHTPVVKIEKNTVHLQDGKQIKADFIIWAAGIKPPAVLKTLGLTVNTQGQIVVKDTLQTVDDFDIFGLGDCVSCPWIGHPTPNQTVPPRAQAAHQQANVLFKTMKRRLQGKSLLTFRYRDLGSLISLSHFSAVGHLKGGSINRGVTIKGWVAKLLYNSLYRLHLSALHGVIPMILNTVAQWLTRSIRPRIKLH